VIIWRTSSVRRKFTSYPSCQKQRRARCKSTSFAASNPPSPNNDDSDGRYTIVPEAGEEHLDAATAAAKGPDYLFNELNERLAKGPIKFKITVQVAGDGDVVNDATVHWPAERKVVELGTIALTSAVANNAHEQKHIIFDPIPRLDGIEPSDDPLLELRAAVYLISGRRRRTAPEQ